MKVHEDSPLWLKAVAHTEGGARGARPPPYGQDRKYHNKLRSRAFQRYQALDISSNGSDAIKV